MKFNTAISAMMAYMNECSKWPNRPRACMEPLVLMLSAYAPHIAEELWERLGHQESLSHHSWPSFDPSLLEEATYVLPVQVNGKMRGKVDVGAGADEDAAVGAAMGIHKVANAVRDKTVVKVIFVPKKILNLIVK